MISFKEAYKKVLENYSDWGTETVLLEQSHGRVLAEDIFADRDFPPFDRVTKDGVAIQHEAYKGGKKSFEILTVAAAGDAIKSLESTSSCIEVMTGAILPKGTDTVVMYEHITIKDGIAAIEEEPRKGQNIHLQGSDEAKGNKVLSKNTQINSAEIGVLASVGKARVSVKVLPRVAIVSTGNELVEINDNPEPHQIRKSNSYTLRAALQFEGIDATLLHYKDSKEETETGLLNALKNFDIIILSGGVSKGKFDYLPQVLDTIGVEKLFHRVKQRPGKPFWFGKHHGTSTTIFAFPGNPASTFANYHIYFLPWLKKSLGLPLNTIQVALNEHFKNEINLTRFIRVSVHLEDGMIKANLVMGNGSGDLTSLVQSNGFVLIAPKNEHKRGDLVPFIPTKTLL